MRVLVVDESPERAELLREALSNAGHDVTAASCSLLALLQTIEQLAPDVLVIDRNRVESTLAQLAEANLKLTERKVVERAKGLLMKTRSLDEEAAYAALRKMAMDRKQKLREVAQQVIDAADLLGA